MPVLKVKKNGVWEPISGGGSGGGVSSWNDLTDKPFYSEVVEKEIYDVNAELAAVSGSLYSMQVSATEYLHSVNAIDGVPSYYLNTVNLTEGNKYIVIVDGNRYEYTAKGMQLGASFNNAYCIYLGEAEAFLTQDLANFTIGFALMSWPNGFTNFVIGCKTTSATAPTSFKVYELVEEVVQLDPKYYERLAWAEEGFINTWEFDGNPRDLPVFEDVVTGSGSKFVYTGAGYLTPSQLEGTEINCYYYDDDRTSTSTVFADSVQDMSSFIGAPAGTVYIANNSLLVSAVAEPSMGLSAGIYAWFDDSYGYVSKIVTNQNIFEGEIVHKIDPKFLPDMNNGGEDVGGADCVGWTGEGENSVVFNSQSNEAIGNYSLAEGFETRAVGEASHAEGSETIAYGITSHAEGYNTQAGDSYDNSRGSYSHAEGSCTYTYGESSHAEGYLSETNGKYSHAEGLSTVAVGTASHAEGYDAEAVGLYSHAEGQYSLTAGQGAHSEGFATFAYGPYAHAEGKGSILQIQISGDAGSRTYTTNYRVHESWCNSYLRVTGEIEGDSDIFKIIYVNTSDNTIELDRTIHSSILMNNRNASLITSFASGEGSQTEGYHTRAEGEYSHAEGCNTITTRDYQHAQGKYNIEDTWWQLGYDFGKYAHIVGNGTSDEDRSNAHTLDWNGIGWFQGGLQIGGNAQDDGAAIVPAIQTAQVGQVIAVKSVDSNGRPTEWEAITVSGGSVNEDSVLITVEDIDAICGSSIVMASEVMF